MDQTVQRTSTDVLMDATRFTFKAICGSDPVVEEGAVEEPEAGSVQGIIAVVGDLSWSLSLAFSPKTAEAIAHKFSGFTIAYESADMNDVIGELANVMAGDVVARLDRLGHKVKMSLPTVARGRGLHMIHPGAEALSRFCLRLPQGQAWVGLATAKGNKA
jgi:chemotaxis protein CheX